MQPRAHSAHEDYYYYQHGISEERMMNGDDMRVCVDGLKALGQQPKDNTHAQ